MFSQISDFLSDHRYRLLAVLVVVGGVALIVIIIVLATVL